MVGLCARLIKMESGLVTEEEAVYVKIIRGRI